MNMGQTPVLQFENFGIGVDQRDTILSDKPLWG